MRLMQHVDGLSPLLQRTVMRARFALATIQKVLCVGMLTGGDLASRQ